VALGLGVWGLATAVIVRAIFGTGTMIRLGGELGIVRPRWSWSHVRPVIGFGARYQANQLLYIVRDQGLNVVVALAAGLATLGVWNLAWRVLQVPNLLFMTVGRISFPAVSRLIGSGHQMRPVIERAVAALAALTGIVAVALIGLGHALPSIVGADWGEVPTVLLWAGVALIVATPVVFATTGYLLAVDDVGAVAAGTAAGAAIWFAVTVVLVEPLGAAAIGIGWAAGGLVNAVLLWRRTTTRTGARIGAHVLGPTAVALAAAAAAWLPARELDGALLRAAAGLGAGELVALAGLALVSRPALRDLRSLGAQAVASVRPGGAN
jgi:O-antigen/teichoic acid export membrane protein